MQITHIDVTPMELPLRLPYRTAYHGEEEVQHAGVVFIRIETRQGYVAWGCAAFDPQITGETMASVTRACEQCAARARDLNPMNISYALAELEQLTPKTPSALCAFDIAFHDLISLAVGMPLHRLMGGYRSRIQTSVTINVGDTQETVAMAQKRARQGFRILKIKGGINPQEDVRRVRAVREALPNLTLRLDADQGYDIPQALSVARALEGHIEMLEQPVPAASGVAALRQVTRQSKAPILADQSTLDPASALEIAGHAAADGISIKLATCGGIDRARQMVAIARAARLATMIGCVNEPALLIAAGLAFALSNAGVRYVDLDGHFDLAEDPTQERFRLEEGWLIASDVPGLGCTVAL